MNASPENLQKMELFQEVDQSTLLLSRKGVRELVLTNSDRYYQLTSVFSCLELINLHLRNCFFNPPLEFEGFLHLKRLYLQNIVFRANLCGTHINFPQLNKFVLRTSTDIYNFNIKATKLQSLKIFNCSDGMLLQLLHSPHIINLDIYSSFQFQASIKGLVPVE
uniref:FBD domain-containing protein n=1 Tax=Lactuca sativa TaxID=4236 RepID=A0A9R1WLZ7_LACSA|nr:hypothetical protein LSAT_V11C100032650 [Lactuca sativa]